MPSPSNPSEQIIDLESMLVQVTRALTAAVEALDDAFEGRPALIERQVVYQIPRMSVSVRLSLTVSEGKIKGFLVNKSSQEISQEVLSTINLEFAAVPRPEGPRPRLLRLTTPRMVGEDVRVLQEKLQKWLTTQGSPKTLVLDGDFGVQTEEALRDFQKSCSISADGILNEATRSALWSEVP